MKLITDAQIFKNKQNYLDNTITTPNYYVYRKHLIENIISCHNSVKLVLIQAPAGYGKTSLMEQYNKWCQLNKIDTCWISIDSSMNDFDEFIQSISNAINDVVENNGKNKIGLIDRIIKHRKPLKIFIDEIEIINNNLILKFLENLLDFLPPNLQLIVSTRRILKINLGKLRIKREVLDFYFNDLRFTYEECKVFLNKHLSYNLDDVEIDLLNEKTEGWPAAVQLASLAIREQKNKISFLKSFSTINNELSDFLAEEILDIMDKNDKDFLLKISLLDQIDHEICEYITGDKNAKEILYKLYKDNYFLIPIDLNKIKFKLHALFKDFLKNKIHESVKFDVNVLNAKIAEWYLDKKNITLAINHFIEAQDLKKTVYLLKKHAKQFLIAGRVRKILKWLNHLNIESHQYDDDFELRLIYAWALILNRQQFKVETIIDKLVDKFHQDLEKFQQIQIVMCLQLSMNDKILECHNLSSQLLGTIQVSYKFERSILSSIASFCLISLGKYIDARKLIANSLHNDASLKFSFVRNLSDSQDGLIDFLQGNSLIAISKFEICYESYWYGESNILSGGIANISIPYAQALYDINQLDKSERILAETLSYARENGTTDLIILGYVLYAKIYYKKGKRLSCFKILKELESISQKLNIERMNACSKIEFFRIHWLEGNLFEAQNVYSELCNFEFWDSYTSYILPSLDEDDLKSVAWRLNITNGNASKVIQEVTEEIEIVKIFNRRRKLIKLQLILSLAYFSMSNIEMSFKYLLNVLKQSSQNGIINLILDEGTNIQLLIKLLLNSFDYKKHLSKINIEYLEQLKLLINVDHISIDNTIFKNSIFDKISSTIKMLNVNNSLTIDHNVSKREIEVLTLLEKGLSNRSIAEKLFLSETTVKAHLRNINSKLSASNRTESVAIARDLGLI